jgi:hypothetical protein
MGRTKNQKKLNKQKKSSDKNLSGVTYFLLLLTTLTQLC